MLQMYADPICMVDGQCSTSSTSICDKDDVRQLDPIPYIWLTVNVVQQAVPQYVTRMLSVSWMPIPYTWLTANARKQVVPPFMNVWIFASCLPIRYK